MEPSKYSRNPATVLANLVEMPDGTVVTKKGCKIYIPSRYTERGLAEVGMETRTLGLYVMTVEDKYYSVCSVNAVMELSPSSTSKVRVGGDEYYEFVFDAGAVVIKNVMLVKDDSVLFKIYNEMFSKGNVPWFITQEDFSNVFATSGYHAGANIGQTPEVIDVLVALIARTKKDRTVHYRTQIKSREEMFTNPPVYIALKSVTYASTNTTNKIAGSYFSTGVLSALVYPAERTEKIEEILRS